MTTHTARLAFHRYLVYGALLLIILLTTLANLRWIVVNVGLIGRDPPGHLTESIDIAHILEAGGVQAIFQAITSDEFRPPLLYLMTQPAYATLGRATDVAQMPNFLLFALILWFTFLLARRSSGDWMAIFAVALLSLLPMAVAMTRLYYMENSLTAALLIALYALLRSDGFRNRRWSIIFGTAVGIALLAKWTAPVYLALAVFYVLWREKFWQNQRQAFTTFQPHWKTGLTALGVSAVLAMLWYLPNRDFVAEQGMAIGDWLPVLWTLLGATALYALLRWRGQAGNFWTALLLAALIASLWYLPRFAVFTSLTDVAFGTDRGTNAPPDLLQAEAYLRYFRFWIVDHMGLLASLIILPLALLGWVIRWRREHGIHQDTLIYALIIAGSWIVFTLLTQSDPRNLVPLLPLIAILLAASLYGYSHNLATGIGILWLSLLLLQWTFITYDEAAPIAARTPALWVHGDYSAPPATGSTDPGYWIWPDVLETIGSPEGDAESLGMLIDTWDMHRGELRYLVTLHNLNITVNALTEIESSSWGDALTNRWILLKDGDNSEVKSPGQAILARIAQGDDIFEQLYAPVKKYPLPNGETATLYMRDGPRQPRSYPVILIETAPIADALNQWWSPHATLVFGDRDVAVWLAAQNLTADRVLMPASDDGAFSEPLDSLTDTIFVVSRYDHTTRDQIVQNGYFARTVTSGDTTLDVVGRPRQPLQTLTSASPWNEVSIDGVRSLTESAPGAVLPVEMALTPQGETPLKLSVRLLASDGVVVAQNDVSADSSVKFGLLIPPNTPAGVYTLGAVLYDPATLAELSTQDGEVLGAIAQITVGETVGE
jgi:4-amino-4-deoxy-L-arabinose transferase-like glycosyltransferase